MAARSATVTNLRFRMGEVGTARTRVLNLQITFSNAVDDWTVTVPSISTDDLRLVLRQLDLDRAQDSSAREAVTDKALNVRVSP